MTRKILVVDDCESICNQLCSLLESESEFIVLDVVHDGHEAIQATLKHEPDIVIMDINMPLMDGIEATREINKHPIHTKILAFSISSDIEIIVQMLEMGAMGFLQKSNAPEEMFKAIRNILRNKIYLSNRMIVPILDYLQGSHMAQHIISSAFTVKERVFLLALAQINTHDSIDAKIRLEAGKDDIFQNKLIKKLNLPQTSDLLEFSKRHSHLF